MRAVAVALPAVVVAAVSLLLRAVAAVVAAIVSLLHRLPLVVVAIVSLLLHLPVVVVRGISRVLGSLPVVALEGSVVPRVVVPVLSFVPLVVRVAPDGVVLVLAVVADVAAVRLD